MTEYQEELNSLTKQLISMGATIHLLNEELRKLKGDNVIIRGENDDLRLAIRLHQKSELEKEYKKSKQANAELLAALERAMDSHNRGASRLTDVLADEFESLISKHKAN